MKNQLPAADSPQTHIPFQILPCSRTEIPALLDLASEIFIETFAPLNTQAAMDGYMSEAYTLEKWQQEFENPDSSFFVVKQADRLVAYLKLNEGDAQNEFREAAGMEIERFYILHQFHGKGLGQILMDFALEQAKAKNKSYLWLGVWEHNPRAQRFYTKMGFRFIGAHPFVMGPEIQTDLLMRREVEA